jgi:DNA-binding NarL/FixJ family response regulator
MLTKREREVVKLVSEGLKDKVIAEKLLISTPKVKKILRCLYWRYDCSGRTQLVMYCYEKGMMNSAE